MLKIINNQLLTILITILMISSTLIGFPFSILTIGERNESDHTFDNGDWIINNVTHLRNDTIILQGNLSIENGGKLVLNNVLLKMNCSFNGEFGIFVESGGELEIFNSTITSTDYSNEKHPRAIIFYTFEVLGTLTIDNTDISAIGYFTKDSDYFYRNRPSGIQIHSDNVIINNSYIHHNYYDGISAINSSPIIKNNRIENNGEGGIFLYGSSSLIENNTIYNHIDLRWVDGETTYGGVGIHGISSDPIILFNTVSGNGVGILLRDSNGLIQNNNISSNYEDGLRILTSSVNIFDNYISNNTRNGMIVSGYNSNIESNTINMNGNGILSSYFFGQIKNNTINNNSNGIYSYYSNPSIVHNSICDNNWGIYSIAGKPILQNTSYNGNKEGRFVQYWGLIINIEYNNNSHVYGANITLYNIFNNITKDRFGKTISGCIYNKGIDPCGREILDPETHQLWYSINLSVKEYEINNNGDIISYSPFQIFGEKDGLYNLTTIILDDNKEISLILNQLDIDGDKIPNNIDDDDDNDGYDDNIELNEDPPSDPYNNESRPKDYDQDLIPDSIDEDDDNDGIPDDEDDCPYGGSKCDIEKRDLGTFYLAFVIIIIVVIIITFIIIHKKQEKSS